MVSGTDHLFPGKLFISTILETLETKQSMSSTMVRRYLQRAAMAGMIIGLLYVAHFSLMATFASWSLGPTALTGIGRILGGLTFGWALVFIYYSKSELLTSNMMIVTIGAYHRGTSWRQALRLLGLCYVGNFLGGALMAAIYRLSSLVDGAVLTQIDAVVEHKLSFIAAGPGGWADLLARAILCNFTINLAMLLVYNGLIKDDLTKSLVMIVSVFVFVFLGLEHSVANTVLFTIIGIEHGIDLPLALGNIAVALVGNYIGGGLLIGLYYAYVNDDRRFRENRGSQL